MDLHFTENSDGSFTIDINEYRMRNIEVQDIVEYIRRCFSEIDPYLVSKIRICGWNFEVPSDIFSPFKNLIHLEIDDNNLLNEVPDLPKNLETLEFNTAPIKNFSKGLPENLKVLSLDFCDELETLPKELPKNLVDLDLGYCDSLKELPAELPKDLRFLNLEGCLIKTLPKELPKELYILNISGCENLETLPEKLPENLYSLDIRDCDNLKYDPKNLPENLGVLSLGFYRSDKNYSYYITNKIHLKDLRLPNLEVLGILDRDLECFKFEDCLFSLGIQHKCICYYTTTEDYQKSPLLKQHTLETYSSIYASRRTRHLDDFTNLIKSRFELWSLREEGARFRQAHREFEELFG